MREALDEADAAVPDGDAVDALASLGADAALLPTGAARLMAAVSALPTRYAPFYDKLGELWDLDEAGVVRELTRAAEPTAWRRRGLPGVRSLAVAAGPRLAGARARLTRFEPGLVFPRHRHAGREATLVLEGSYCDESGRRTSAGDRRDMLPGTTHSVRVDSAEPCILASVDFGLEFTGPVMRLLTAFSRKKR
ncbi:MAG TPA: cupin domain-containing protein [Polyangiaceae bacterium]|nr:cupin domain-containing protein [Polyangiaceae bacterium]